MKTLNEESGYRPWSNDSAAIWSILECSGNTYLDTENNIENL